MNAAAPNPAAGFTGLGVLATHPVVYLNPQIGLYIAHRAHIRLLEKQLEDGTSEAGGKESRGI
jgi:hypothetical protein